jgi:hypothetical protein
MLNLILKLMKVLNFVINYACNVVRPKINFLKNDLRLIEFYKNLIKFNYNFKVIEIGISKNHACCVARFKRNIK